MMHNRSLKQVQSTLMVASLSTLLTACAAQNCDPNRTDLFSGAGCSLGGGYAQRTSDLKAQLGATDAEAAAARAYANQEAQAARSAQQTLATRQAELRALDSRMSTLRRRLATAETNHTASADQLTKAKAALDNATSARKAISSADPNAKDLAKVIEQQKRAVRLMSSI